MLANTELSLYIKKYLCDIIPELLYQFLETCENDQNPLSTLKLLYLYLSKRTVIIELISKYLKWLSRRITLYEGNCELMSLYFTLTFYVCDNSSLSPETFFSQNFLSRFKASSIFNIKFYVNKLLALLLNIPDHTKYMEFHPSDDIIEIQPDYFPVSFEDCWSGITFNMCKSFDKRDFSERFFPIFSMLLRMQGEMGRNLEEQQLQQLVLTNTTIKNLKSLVLGFSTGSIVLVSGDIGCGKTSLIEYFAQCLGRTSPPSILKLQLGDQIESKVCTVKYCF